MKRRIISADQARNLREMEEDRARLWALIERNRADGNLPIRRSALGEEDAAWAERGEESQDPGDWEPA